MDFRNTILIMTSNVGAELLKKHGSLGFTPQSTEYNYEQMKKQLMDEVRRTFKPEFLNRIDEIIVFKALSREDLHKILEIELSYLKLRLKEQNIQIELAQSVKEFLIEKGFDEVYGARPIKRTLQRYLEDRLSEELISGKIPKGVLINVKRKDDALVFEV